MKAVFYNDSIYKQKQSAKTRKNWQDGRYNFLIQTPLIRNCKNPGCKNTFEIKLSNHKIYCSRHCAVIVNNQKRGLLQKDELHKLYLLGLGLGLYWGEGNKLNKTSVRLSNIDPNLINFFIKFLIEIFGVKKKDLKFSLQIFTDIDTQAAMEYWIRKLRIKKEQFYKPIITLSGSLGTYRKKSEYGVIIVYYHNRKLRDLLVGMLPTWLSGRAAPW